MKIRIFLAAGFQRLLHDIVRETVANQNDMELVSDSFAGGDLYELLSTGGLDLVIVGADRPMDVASISSILFTSPRVKLLAIENNGRTATIYRLRPHQSFLGELSPPELLAAIRAEMASQ